VTCPNYSFFLSRNFKEWQPHMWGGSHVPVQPEMYLFNLSLKYLLGWTSTTRKPMLVGQKQYWWVLSFSLITDRSRSLCHNYFICLSYKASNDQILNFLTLTYYQFVCFSNTMFINFLNYFFIILNCCA
jgi:hypothetical protein